MQLTFWGTRGSIPSPGPDTVRYGGNTPCVELRPSNGRLVILDCGTGLRALGGALIAGDGGAPIVGDVFVTHAHWDHIQGLPFFAPIFRQGNHFTIHGPAALATGLDRVIRDQMSPVVFPVSFEQLDATIDFRELRPGESAGRGYTVTCCEVRHPGGALGYRFADADAPDRGLVYVSDNELAESVTYDTAPADWRARLVAFCKGARVLVHDATYTTAEADRHRGWGHSTAEEAVRLAADAGVERLVLFHHRPERTDDEVDAELAAARAVAARLGGPRDVVAAAEGLTLTV
jgi:phosphoribosyl 1,2-cyclic phosphodiesterase